MKLFVCIVDDARLLAHFLRHYTQFGVTEFHIACPRHLADNVTAASRDYIVYQYNHFDVVDSVVGGVSAVTNMRSLSQFSDEWVVVVDLDEFVEFGAPIGELIPRMVIEGANVARGILYDRFALDGLPKAFDDKTNLSELFAVKARFIRDVMRGIDTKAVMVRGHLVSDIAHHRFLGERPFSRILEISHYKWNDRSLARLLLAYDLVLKEGLGWAVEYKRILDHFEEHGRFAWESFGGRMAAGTEALGDKKLEGIVSALRGRFTRARSRVFGWIGLKRARNADRRARAKVRC